MAPKAEDRAREYRATAGKLRKVAQEAKDPATKAELSWLAHSYDLLAAKAEHGEAHLAVQDGDRSLEIPERTAKSR
jgi:hypothetical protein